MGVLWTAFTRSLKRKVLNAEIINPRKRNGIFTQIEEIKNQAMEVQRNHLVERCCPQTFQSSSTWHEYPNLKRIWCEMSLINWDLYESKILTTGAHKIRLVNVIDMDKFLHIVRVIHYISIHACLYKETVHQLHRSEYVFWWLRYENDVFSPCSLWIFFGAFPFKNVLFSILFFFN